MSSWAPVTAETKAMSIFLELRYVEATGAAWGSNKDVASPKVTDCFHGEVCLVCVVPSTLFSSKDL